MRDSSPSGEKKRRISLSKMFGGRKDKESQHSRDPPSTTSNAADSAYASSENASDFVPMKNSGQFSGVNADRNLAMNKTTGDVRDQDTGEVITTVTTTTTTTTTTTKTGKDGKKQVVEVQTTPGTSQVQEMPADGPSPGAQNLGVNETRSYSTSPGPQSHLSPDVAYRNPNRRSGENLYRSSRDMAENPVSPVDAQGRHNFSYPSRGNLREGMDDPTTQQRKSGTIESLKAAAIGIHVSFVMLL